MRTALMAASVPSPPKRTRPHLLLNRPRFGANSAPVASVCSKLDEKALALAARNQLCLIGDIVVTRRTPGTLTPFSSPRPPGPAATVSTLLAPPPPSSSPWPPLRGCESFLISADGSHAVDARSLHPADEAGLQPEDRTSACTRRTPMKCSARSSDIGYRVRSCQRAASSTATWRCTAPQPTLVRLLLRRARHVEAHVRVELVFRTAEQPQVVGASGQFFGALLEMTLPISSPERTAKAPLANDCVRRNVVMLLGVVRHHAG